MPTDVLFASAFQYADRRLFFTKARLYEDRIVFRGWSLQGRHERVVRLEDIEQADWWTGAEDAVNLSLHLRGGEVVNLGLKAAGLWKFKIEEVAGRRLSAPMRATKPMVSAA